MKSKNFADLGLSPEIMSAITEMGFTEASHIQVESIPNIQKGLDLVGQAQTGTGKTAAFGIPLIDKLKDEDRFPTSLVLCPTRELALQVANELKKLAKFRRMVQILPVYGGESIQMQIRDLRKGPQVVVGTPGRIIDHIERGTLQLEKINMVVLDEADEMLNMGFREDIENILSNVPVERQTVLFSATMPKAILGIIHKFQKEPVHVKITREKLTNASIEQIYYELDRKAKDKAVSNIIKINDIKSAIVFCNTKRKVDELVEVLKKCELKAAALHGDLSQMQRNKVMLTFRDGMINVLVATDVAARGLDISHVDAVFNYDLPSDYEYYVHRIGRTGRAGKTGQAFSFITGRNEYRLLKDIEYFTKATIKRQNVPTDHEIAIYEKSKFVTMVKEVVEEGKFKKQLLMLTEFAALGIDSDTLACALLKLLHSPEVKPEAEKKEEVPRDDYGRGEYRRDDRRSDDRRDNYRRDDRGSDNRRGSYSTSRPRTSSSSGTKDYSNRETRYSAQEIVEGIEGSSSSERRPARRSSSDRPSSDSSSYQRRERSSSYSGTDRREGSRKGSDSFGAPLRRSRKTKSDFSSGGKY